MARDFNDLIVATTDWLDEAGVGAGGLGGTGTDFATASAEFKRWVNRAYQEIYREIARTNPTFIAVDTELISWVNGTETYTLSNTDVHTIGWVEGGWDESDEDKRVAILPVDYDERRNHYGEAWVDLSNNDYYGRWYLLTEEGTRKIGFTPVPGTSKTNNIKIWYHKNPADFTLTGDEIAIELDPYESLIAVRAALMIANKAGESRPLLMEEFSRQLADMKDNITRPQKMRSRSVKYITNDIFDTLT